MRCLARLIAPFCLSLVFGPCSPGPASPSDGYALVSAIPYGCTSASTNLCAYDSDHDGLEELFICHGSTIRVFEYAGDNQYEKVDSLEQVGLWTVGDIDEDGLADLVVQNATHVMVYESVRADSLDCQKVWEWESYAAGLAAPTYITDADRDGWNELFVQSLTWLLDFERTGDNTYSEVWRDTTLDSLRPVAALLAFGDFDGDRKTEFVTSTTWGGYFVFENADSAVDDFGLVRVDSIPNLNNAYYKSSSPDMDGDGAMELIIAGNRDGATGWTWQMSVLEATGDNSYEITWSDSIADCPWLNDSWISCGDVDGDSVNEILWGIGAKGIFLYECTGPDTWECVWNYPVSGRISNVLVYDINNNGCAEMIMARTDSTLIFEKEGVGVAEWERERPESAILLEQNSPNPFHRSTVIQYSLPAGCDVTLSVYDITGSLMETLVEGKQGPGIFRARWNGQGHADGIYFYRLQAGAFTETRKMVVVR